MDAGRRHKKPVSETKDFITLGTDSMLSQFPSRFIVPFREEERSFAEGPDGCLHMQCVVLQERDSEYGEWTTL